MSAKTMFPFFKWSCPEFLKTDQIPHFEKALSGLRTKASSGEVGFYQWPQLISEKLIEDIEKTGNWLRENFEGALIFGIGGSFLGAYAAQEFLGADESFPVHWISNIDPFEIDKMEKIVRQRKWAAVVISKSGGTLETLSAFYYLSSHFSPDGIVAITDPTAGELRALSLKQGWKTLPVPENIGGRFSVLTPVGLLPLHLMGISIRDLLAGAKQALWHSETHESENHLPLQYAALLYDWAENRKKNIHYYFVYAKNLTWFGEWLVQLFAESLGKHQKGFTPVTAVGTEDQHSLLQLFKEGPRDKVIGFFHLSAPSKNRTIPSPSFLDQRPFFVGQTFERITHEAVLAVQESLSAEGVPTYLIDIEERSPNALGSLFFFFETACALAGELYGFNAFDQPGVEDAKIRLKKRLSP